MSLKAVIFDMDGVLTDTVEYHYRSWKKVLSEYGIPFTRHENQKTLGLTRRRSLEAILGDRRLPEAQMQAILEKKNRYFSSFLREMSKQDLLPGVSRLLAELERSGLKIGVASSSRNVEPILAQLGILDLVDALVDGNQIQRSKPAPDSFLLAARALGVNPQDCLVIEDSPAGIRGALAGGIGVLGLGPIDLVGEANAVYPDLTQVGVGDLRRIHRRVSQRLVVGSQISSYQ